MRRAAISFKKAFVYFSPHVLLLHGLVSLCAFLSYAQKFSRFSLEIFSLHREIVSDGMKNPRSRKFLNFSPTQIFTSPGHHEVNYRSDNVHLGI